MISRDKQESSDGVVAVAVMWLLFYIAMTAYGFAHHPASSPGTELVSAAAGR